MKSSYYLIVLITFVLSFLNKVNAINVNDFEFGKEGHYYIKTSSLLVFSNKAYLSSCLYNQSKKNINCYFKDEKYNSEKLYVNIPLYHIDEFKENDIPKSSTIFHAFINDYQNDQCVSDEIAATSRFGIKENKKMYFNKNENYGNCFEFEMEGVKEPKRLYYSTVLIEKQK
ncbi:hypothetical protein BCR32DRAFT_327765 [Anaeromyces robustus]|uniref:Uncharacterized protein n=1 Tax=Anaeromyces robustus TaxID=1754192 RepID=A0A1Y1X3J5_9FUNG|nr:hypothetical protein BCR32DRAFT_327765 [Anaeromyces robustus]|eukprot:ORX80272.1 hypothetical protein BCR32DRAFT_327765 [Anaeromyces robustus]